MPSPSSLRSGAPKFGMQLSHVGNELASPAPAPLPPLLLPPLLLPPLLLPSPPPPSPPRLLLLAKVLLLVLSPRPEAGSAAGVWGERGGVAEREELGDERGGEVHSEGLIDEGEARAHRGDARAGAQALLPLALLPFEVVESSPRPVGAPVGATGERAPPVRDGTAAAAAAAAAAPTPASGCCAFLRTWLPLLEEAVEEKELLLAVLPSLLGLGEVFLFALSTLSKIPPDRGEPDLATRAAAADGEAARPPLR